MYTSCSINNRHTPEPSCVKACIPWLMESWRLWIIIIFLSQTTVTAYDTTSIDTTTVTVVTEDLFPLSYVDPQSGEISGVATEIIRKVFAGTDLQYQIKLMPWTQAYAEATSKPNTLIFSIARIPTREDKFIWLSKITDLNYALYSPDKTLKTASLEELKQLFVTVTKNDLSHNILSQLGFSNFVFIKQNQRYDDLLAKDQIDLMLSSNLWMLQNQGRLPTPLYRLENVRLPSTQTSIYYAMNLRSDSAVIQKLRDSFKANITTGTYATLLSVYLSEPNDQK